MFQHSKVGALVPAHRLSGASKEVVKPLVLTTSMKYVHTNPNIIFELVVIKQDRTLHAKGIEANLYSLFIIQ